MSAGRYLNVTNQVLARSWWRFKVGGKEAAWRMLRYRNYGGYMNSAHLVTEPAARRVKKTKPHQKRRGRPRNAKSSAHGTYDTTMAAAGTLTRTKALLLAALRVWELKHRIHDQ